MAKTTRKLLLSSSRGNQNASSVFGSTTLAVCGSLIVIFLAIQCYLIFSFINRTELIHRAVPLIDCAEVDGVIPSMCNGKLKEALQSPVSVGDHPAREWISSKRRVRRNSDIVKEDENDACPSFKGEKVEIYEKGHSRKALVVFASPRSGSTTLQSMMKAIDETTDNKDFHLLAQGGLFTYDNSGYFSIVSTARLLLKSCESNHRSIGKDYWSSGGIKDAVKEENWARFQNLMEKHESTSKLLTKFRLRFESVSKYFLYMKRVVPQISRRPFFTFKVFDFHLKKKGAGMSVDNFVREMKDVWKGKDEDTFKVIVLWRRCMIEQFVSNKIAASRKMFTKMSTTEKDAIHVDKGELEEFLEKRRRYYLDVKQALSDNGVPFEVLEYDRDIKNDSNKVETRRRLLKMFGLSNGHQEDDSEKLASTEKQSIVTVDKLILNFEEVKAWGYVRPLDEWEDLFSDHPNALA